MAKTPRADELKKNVQVLAEPEYPQPDISESESIAEPALEIDCAPRRLAVVVLSMHRTGSSALTRILNLLGCDAAKNLMGPDQNNHSGYWESDSLRVFNDQLLASGGSDWRDWRPFNSGWYHTPRLGEYLERGRDLLKAEYGHSPLFVFKDPRVTRIFPFWRQLLKSENVDIRVLLTLRHPAEVAASLKKRDNISDIEAALIWLRNLLDAEEASRGLPRGVIDYNRLLAAPSTTMAAVQDQLKMTWPRLSSKVAEEIDGFMTPELHHHIAAEENSFPERQPLRAWLTQVYTIFRRWSEAGETTEDHAVLDGLRHSIDALVTPLHEMVNTIKLQSLQAVEKDNEITSLKDKLMQQNAILSELETEIAGLRDDLAASEEAFSAVQQQQNLLSKSLSEAQNALHLERQKVDETENLLQQVRQELGATKAKEARLVAARTKDCDALDALRQASEERTDEILILTQSLINRDETISTQMSEICYLKKMAKEGRTLCDRIDQAIEAIMVQVERPWLHSRGKLSRKVALLNSSGLFDAEWYGKTYADVRKAEIDPASHFILFGRAEGRQPLPELSNFLQYFRNMA